MNIETTLLEFQEWLNVVLSQKIEEIQVVDPAQERIKQAISYCVLGGGKRMRAFIIAQSCQMYGIGRNEVAPLLVAIEMVHAYSLIHDDLPCMDNSNERRGKPATHIYFDEATALLTGNALLGLAFDEILSKNFLVENYIKINLLKALSKATGYYGMMAGQMFDIILNGTKEIPTEHFIHMNKLKTGELFAFCMSSGSILTQNIENIETMAKIGYDFGYIFQVVDDILDLDEDTKATNELNMKRNFINHIGGVDSAKKHLIFIINQLSERVEQMPFDMVSIVSLVDYVFKRIC